MVQATDWRTEEPYLVINYWELYWYNLTQSGTKNISVFGTFCIDVYTVLLRFWKILKDTQVNVIKEPTSSQISGFFMRNKDLCLVFINSSKSVGHQNFTAAHEFYHYRFDENLKGRACVAGKFESNQPLERKADYFAAYLLAPDEAIKFHLNRRREWKPIHKIDLNDIIALEQVLGLSHTAMLRRLRSMELISEEQIDLWCSGVVKTARQLGYSTHLYEPSNETIVLSDYAEKAKAALEAGLINEARYEELILAGGMVDILFGEEIEEGDLI